MQANDAVTRHRAPQQDRRGCQGESPGHQHSAGVFHLAPSDSRWQPRARELILQVPSEGTLQHGTSKNPTSKKTLLVGKWESTMVPSSDRNAYDPEVLTVMGIAFDNVCNCLPDQFRESDSLRRKLALHIIHQVDDGESDPIRLANSALFSLLFW